MSAELQPSSPSKEEAIALLRGGLGAEMQRIAAGYVMPLCWIFADHGSPLIPDNGSAFLLDAGEGPFLVTAAHVHRGYMAAKAEHHDAICIIGEERFPLEERLIAEDPLFDVATFRVEPAEVTRFAKAGKIVLRGSNSAWPPGPPEVDKGVFFVGFPGDGRVMRPYRRGSNLVEVDWLGYTALASATSVSTASLALVFDHDSNLDIGQRAQVPSNLALGGCSGAPILTFVERRGVFSWQLGGIIYESGTMFGSSTFVKASRVDCLRADGTIVTYPDAMAKPRAELGLDDVTE